MFKLLDGRVALVTGGSRGIGAAMCVRLAEHGATVVVNYLRSHDAARGVVSEITGAGGRAVAIAADVSQAEDVSAMVSQCSEAYGKVDVLVNNAIPGYQTGTIETLRWETYQWYVDNIVRAAYNTVGAVVPFMKAQHWGRIINIGTTSLYELNSQETAYIAAKGALLALTRGLARDLGPDNICVNMVSPGLVYRGSEPCPPEWGGQHASRAALGRTATRDEVAGAVTFFASSLSDGITGTHLPVCAGLVMQAG